MNATGTTTIKLWPTLVRLSGCYKPHLVLITVGALLGLGLNVASVYIAALQQDVLNALNAGQLDKLYRTLISGGAVIITAVFVGCIGALIKGYLGAKIPRDFRTGMLDHVLRLPMERVDSMHSGDLVSRTSQDATKTTGGIGGNLFALFDTATLMAGAFFYLARINLVATLAAALAGPIIFMSGRFFDKAIRTRGEAIQKNQADLRAFLQDDLQGISVVSVYGLGAQMTNEFSKLRNEARSLNIAQAISWNLLYQAGGVVNTLAMMCCTLLITYQAIIGELSPGSVLAFLILVNRVTWPVVGLSRIWGGFQELLGSAKRVFEILDMKAEPPVQSAHLRLLPRSTAPALQLSGVSFGYANKPGVLEDIDLVVEKGQMVAVVGPSGSGKSTLAKLCLGLYMPAGGTVQVAGYATSQSLQEARCQAAYVSQHPHIFAAGLAENITGELGAKTQDLDNERLGTAIRDAGLEEVISKLPEGLDTRVGERGQTLSGGQRQRVALARALLRRASLVVLDEATSALDNETEAAVSKSVEALRSHAGILVIAHRLTTVMNADYIVVLEEGKITQRGTHDELVAQEGTYARLWALSQGGDELKSGGGEVA